MGMSRCTGGRSGLGLRVPALRETENGLTEGKKEKIKVLNRGADVAKRHDDDE